MKKIQLLLRQFATVLGVPTLQPEVQLISVNQERFCETMAITDYYCNESNLFI